MNEIRVGQGFDLHALVPGRRLLLGGIAIDHHQGLLGHSDADVLLHAICDALLGAAGLGDIGRCFPDDDPAYAGADSRQLAARVVEQVRAAGWTIQNIDATVLAQAPKLAPRMTAINRSVAQTLSIDAARVNIKAKTMERLDAIGRGEAIGAQAVALLSR